MLTNYQQMLLGDLKAANSYGKPLVAWKGQTEFFRDPAAPKLPGALTVSLAATFVEQTYVLVKLMRVVTVYRGYETKGLTAPFGKDHPSFIRGLLAQRKPGTPDSQWWFPGRPSAEIDNLGLSDMQRGEARDSKAVLLEWNRIDYYLEGDLPIGALVYVGRAAPQQESALYGGKKYSGGGYQFWLTEKPETAFRSLKRYAAS